MFYSATKSPTMVTGNSSHINPNQVFTGNYWDEFGITPFLVPDNADVAMLGLAMGGGIRPLLSSSKSINLVGVDCDSETLERCQQLFNTEYPAINFSSVCADVNAFLKDGNKLYDFIWLDIYKAESYCELLFDEQFLRLMKLNLKPGGVIAINCYGIPSQFSPLSGGTLQSQFVGLLQREFPFVGSLPFRRNHTLLVGDRNPQLHFTQPHELLSSMDRMSFETISRRTKGISALPAVPDTSMPKDEDLLFKKIDEQMRAGWPSVIKGLEKYDVHLKSASELLMLIQDERQCSRLLALAIESRDSLISFIPILAAGESHVRDLNVGWLLNWFTEFGEELKESQPQEYELVWLPQLWSLVLNPTKKYRTSCFELISKVRGHA